MTRGRPLSDPRWATTIVWRLAGICAIASVLAYVLVVGIAMAVTTRPPQDAAVQVLAASAAIGASAAAAAWLVRTRIAPAFEVIRWSLAFGAARWRSLGFEGGIPDPDEALVDLARRTDEASIAARATLLAARGETTELGELLDTWHPETATGVATIERHRVTLAALRGGRVDVSTALGAANAIPDAAARIRALVVLRLDAAGRDALAGRNPEPELRAARRLLDGGWSGVPVPDAGPNLPIFGVTLAVVGCAIPVAVAAVLVGGVIALFAWVAAVFAFWAMLRTFLAGRRPAAGRATG